MPVWIAGKPERTWSHVEVFLDFDNLVRTEGDRPYDGNQSVKDRVGHVLALARRLGHRYHVNLYVDLLAMRPSVRDVTEEAVGLGGRGIDIVHCRAVDGQDRVDGHVVRDLRRYHAISRNGVALCLVSGDGDYALAVQKIVPERAVYIGLPTFVRPPRHIAAATGACWVDPGIHLFRAVQSMCGPDSLVRHRAGRELCGDDVRRVRNGIFHVYANTDRQPSFPNMEQARAWVEKILRHKKSVKDEYIHFVCDALVFYELLVADEDGRVAWNQKHSALAYYARPGSTPDAEELDPEDAEPSA